MVVSARVLVEVKAIAENSKTAANRFIVRRSRLESLNKIENAPSLVALCQDRSILTGEFEELWDFYYSRRKTWDLLIKKC